MEDLLSRERRKRKGENPSHMIHRVYAIQCILVVGVQLIVRSDQEGDDEILTTYEWGNWQ